MAIAKRTQTSPWRNGLHLGLVTALFIRAARPLRIAGGWLMGSGSAPRACRREGYPEHELMGIISGRRDRFDGLM